MVSCISVLVVFVNDSYMTDLIFCFSYQITHYLIVYKFQMPILVHEAICISIWRDKILPLLLKIEPEPKSVLVVYMVVSKNFLYNHLLMHIRIGLKMQHIKYGFTFPKEHSACLLQFYLQSCND
jgi:hypothetical protein